MGGLFAFLFYMVFFIIIAASANKKNQNQKYDQAKKAYAKDCKQFDNITSLNDSKKGKLQIVQDEAIKHIEDKKAKQYDDVINNGSYDDEPIKEYKGFFRRLSNKELK